MKLQTKVLTSFLAVGLTVALVGGSTMAWFTDRKDLPASTFTAGTVILDTGTSAVVSTKSPQNINPDDPFSYQLNIKYVGTKPVYLRVKAPSINWTSGNHGINNLKINDADLSIGGVNHHISVGLSVPDLMNSSINAYSDSTRWSYSDGYFYYKDSISGTKEALDANGNRVTVDNAGTTLSLSLNGVYDGALTDNSYQGAHLTISDYTVEVIQATNGAQWPTDGSSVPSR